MLEPKQRYWKKIEIMKCPERRIQEKEKKNISNCWSALLTSLIAVQSVSCEGTGGS